MTGFIPKEKLTAYQRWELAAFDEDEREADSLEKAAAQPADHRAMQSRARELVAHIGRQRGDALGIEIHTRFPQGRR